MHLLLLAVLASPQAADFDALKTRFTEEKSKPSALRLETVAALGALKNEDAGAFLEDVVEQDKDPAVRAEAVRALGVCALPTTLKKLSTIATDTKQLFTLRAAAIEALTRPPTPEGMKTIRVVMRESGEIRWHAWAGLRSYPFAETEALWRTALIDTDTLVRAMGMVALAPLKEVKLQDVARAALANANEESLIKYASVAVLQAAGGVASARVFVAAANTNDPTLRRLLAEALGSLTEDKSALEIYAALRNPEPNVRYVAARALGRLKHPHAGDRLSEPLKDKNLEVRGAALESVAERREKSAEIILQREAQSSNEEAAAIAIGLLPGFPSDATKQLLVKLAANYKPGTAIPALEALGDLRVPESLPVFEKALKSKDWPIRVAAIRGLVKLRQKESIDFLVERMDKEEGRMIAEVGDALKALTGKPFGYGPGTWKEWWGQNRETFVIPDKAQALITSQQGMTTYHGVPVLSNRIVFVTDISGSMTEPAEEGTRMDQSKKELARVLGSLGKDAQINMVFFDDKIEPWHRGLVSIKQNLPQAQAVVARLAPRGRTNIFDALDAAFQHTAADTIYLLSDGDPTDGKIIDPNDILREIRRMNRLRQIVIHSISFGKSDFMRALAEQNGGQYVEIK